MASAVAVAFQPVTAKAEAEAAAELSLYPLRGRERVTFLCLCKEK
jgi:hypothetical protein